MPTLAGSCFKMPTTPTSSFYASNCTDADGCTVIPQATQPSNYNCSQKCAFASPYPCLGCSFDAATGGCDLMFGLPACTSAPSLAPSGSPTRAPTRSGSCYNMATTPSATLWTNNCTAVSGCALVAQTNQPINYDCSQLCDASNPNCLACTYNENTGACELLLELPECTNAPTQVCRKSDM